jgi:type IV pilus assembly protein PilW
MRAQHMLPYLSKNTVKTLRHQCGLSLIELMVALGLGLLLTAAVSQIFLSSRKTETLQDAMSQVQDSGRFALDLIVSDLQRVGYMACNTPWYSSEIDLKINSINAKEQEETVQVIATGSSIKGANFSRQALAGFEYSGSGVLLPAPNNTELQSYLASDTTLTTKGVVSSDVLSFYYGVEDSAMRLAEEHDPGNSPIKITNNNACMNQGDIFLITNCQKTTIARITNTLTPECSGATTTLEYSSSGNNPATIDETYLVNETSVTNLTQINYFVGNTGRTDSNGNAITALYRRINNNAAQEVIEGIESLQIEYGERLPNGNTRFVKATESGLDMGRVFSVRIGLLIRSRSNAFDSNDSKTYVLPGQNIASTGTVKHAGGKYLRRAFITTVKLRNRN